MMNISDKSLSHTSYLIRKYDVPSPRYTSYPTVPYWENTGTEAQWKQLVQDQFHAINSSQGISLYIHLPFCESLCTYCACNKRITVNHEVEEPYIKALIQEWHMYRALMDDEPVIKEIHLGGGTPTFFSPVHLKKLIEAILAGSKVSPDSSFSVEVHPNYTTEEHLKVLADLGFKRISIGIQDFDPKVQFLINRMQSFEKTEWTFNTARKYGYNSINADIIYGLPGQTRDSIRSTIQYIQQLRPDRIAFYSYAHVPWKSKSQRRYTEEDLPGAEEKRSLYMLGKDLLRQAGYRDLGMDHFALPADPLYLAYTAKRLHRNFMGYTTEPTGLIIGLGASSISDSWTGFMQNVKEVEQYEQMVSEGKLPVIKGHALTGEDLLLRRIILNLMCQMEYLLSEEDLKKDYIKEALIRLKDLEEDGLVELYSNKIKVTDIGKGFTRNIAMCFDSRLWKKEPSSPMFSNSI